MLSEVTVALALSFGAILLLSIGFTVWRTRCRVAQTQARVNRGMRVVFDSTGKPIE